MRRWLSAHRHPTFHRPRTRSSKRISSRPHSQARGHRHRKGRASVQASRLFSLCACYARMIALLAAHRAPLRQRVLWLRLQRHERPEPAGACVRRAPVDDLARCAAVRAVEMLDHGCSPNAARAAASASASTSPFQPSNGSRMAFTDMTSASLMRSISNFIRP